MTVFKEEEKKKKKEEGIEKKKKEINFKLFQGRHIVHVRFQKGLVLFFTFCILRLYEVRRYGYEYYEYY